MPKKGKKGIDQRVKGNVQSASSGRMSELLGGGGSGFIGFDSVSSSYGAAEDHDPLLRIHSHFQVVMKQLGKRDSVTKLKALQEYISLCEQEPIEGVVSSLQLWPLMYTKLTMDTDHRVRELSHLAQRTCCERVGRSLGPHLRSLVGPWVAGMCDPHLPSAQTAQSAFTACFPSPVKQVEAIKFGLKSIITFCSDIIIKDSPDTFSDPKTMPEDERIQRYERAVVMAINGYGLCLQKLGREILSQDEVGVIWAGLAKENKLWKLMKHNNPSIRSAIVCLVKTLLTITNYVHEHCSQFCPLILSNLGERDIIVVQPLWDTALLIMSSVHNWYECVNVQKALLPGLWSLLGNGGHGNSHVIYPCLLPLLSELIKRGEKENASGLAGNFITRLKSGLLSDVAKGSSLETSHISKALVECSSHCMGHFLSEEALFIKELIDMVTELIDLIFNAPVVQLEELCTCVCGLINTLVIKEDSSSLLSLSLKELRSTLIHKLYQILNNSGDIKLLPRIATLINKFYPSPSPPITTITVIMMTISSATQSFVLPVISELLSDCFTAHKDSLQHLSLAKSLISSVSKNSQKEWAHQVTSLVQYNIEDSTNNESDPYKVMCMVYIKLLPTQREVKCSEDLEREVSLVDCYVNTVYTDDSSSSERAMEHLITLVQVDIKLLPLILQKLSFYGHSEHYTQLTTQFHSHLLPTPSSLSNSHYWSFLSSLLTTNTSQRDSSTQTNLVLVKDILQALIKLLCGGDKDRRDDDSSGGDIGDSYDKVLSLFTNVESTLIELVIDDVEFLLLHFLNLLCTTTITTDYNIESLMNCYNHLVCCLGEERREEYLKSGTCAVIERLKENNNNLKDILYHGLVYYTLHQSLLSSYWEVYSTVLMDGMNDETNYITPKLLLKCCHGDLPFSPSPSPLTLITVLPSPLSLSLLPLLASCDPSLLRNLLGEELEHYPLTDILLSWLPERLKEGGVPKEGVWQIGVVNTLMMSVLCESLQEDSIYGLITSLVNSSLDWLLKLLTNNNEYLMKTVQYLLKRAEDNYLSSLSLHKLTKLLYTNSTNIISIPNPTINTYSPAISTGISTGITDDIVQCIISSECSVLGLYSLEYVMNEGELAGVHEIEDPCQIAVLLTTDQLQWSDDRLITLLSPIINQEDINLFGDIMESAKDPMVFSLLVLLEGVVNSHNLLEKFWDFLSCTLVTIVQLMSESINELSLEGVVLCCRGLRLVESLHCLLMSSSPAHLIKERSEWVEFFTHTIIDLVLPIFLRPMTTPTNYTHTLTRYFVCRVLDALMTTPTVVMWEELVAMVTSHSHYSEQLTACKLARRCLMSLKIVGDEEKGDTQEHQIKVSTFQCCLDSVLDHMKETTPLGEESTVVGYVLLWLLVVESIGKCHLEVRAQMTDWIKGRGQLFPLLHSLLQHCTVAMATPNLNIDQIKVTLAPSMGSICSCIFMSVSRYIPHLFRQWYLSLDRQTSTVISSFTTRHISQRLWKQEMENMSTNTKIGNLEVRVCAGVSEIIVVYRVDEFSIELTVCIPDNYPLAPPTIREGKRARVDLSLWRKWLLQLNAFVANQNGSILEGLLLWKSNLDKHFAGLDDCMICFSIIHGSNYSLPKMICRTCKKRFHSSCLYKWFSTSNKSSCPLCRNVF